MDKKALIELAKSTGRFIWFGFLALVVTALTALLSAGELQNINVVVGGLEVNLSFVVLGIITAVIKLIDKYIHESNNTTSNGIAPSFLQN
jgi:drug/metabolite transporter (DMT)-like permease